MRECCICICVYCYRLPSRSHGATSNTISSIIINDYQRQDGLGVLYTQIKLYPSTMAPTLGHKTNQSIAENETNHQYHKTIYSSISVTFSLSDIPYLDILGSCNPVTIPVRFIPGPSRPARNIINIFNIWGHNIYIW